MSPGDVGAKQQVDEYKDKYKIPQGLEPAMQHGVYFFGGV